VKTLNMGRTAREGDSIGGKKNLEADATGQKQKTTEMRLVGK
jgi:hypothetical protein